MNKHFKAIGMSELDKVVGGTAPEIIEQKVVYYDEGGHRYETTVKEKTPDIISMKVTYQDAGGKKYTATVG